MSNLLFATWAGGGNVPPVFALAKRLGRRGHAVRVLVPPSLAAGRADEEYSFVEADGVPERVRRRGLLVGEQLEEGTRYLCGPEWRDAVAAELEREPPDVFICDIQLAGASAAAASLAVPIVTICVVLFQAWYREWGGYVLGGESTDDVQERTALTLAMTPAELDFDAGPVPTNVLYVGPVSVPDPVSPFEPPWPAENDDPLVVVSFSTVYQRQEVALRQVVDALAELPVRALLLASESLDGPIPERIQVRSWVPHAAVMPRASLCITHGGCGTMQSALAHGVPLLVMPHTYEQALNGYRVSALGAGKLVRADASATEIRENVVEMLAEPSFGAAAARTSHWFDDGSDRAVEALEALARDA
jgi:UDP:flavonoid glycosyltransferase YjiC (YdhE family)